MSSFVCYLFGCLFFICTDVDIDDKYLIAMVYYRIVCALGCFIKDTLKENKNPNPVRNWGAPRKNISRRRG